MSRRPYPPAYFRYLQARLFIFRQPAFWGISIFLLLIGIISWEYWLKFDILSEPQNLALLSKQSVITPDSTISYEDKSIAADIDNLPVLLNDFDQAALSTTLINAQKITPPQENQSFVEDATPRNSLDTQSKNPINLTQNALPVIEKNPFVTQSENLLQSRSENIDNQFVDTNTLTTQPETIISTNTLLKDKILRNENTVLANPLETAIKQSSNYSNGVITSIPITNNLPSQVSRPSNSMGYIQPTIINQQPSVYPNINNIQTSQPGKFPTSSVTPINSTIPNNSSNVYPNINNVQTSQPGRFPTSSVTPINSTIPNNPYSVQNTKPVVVNPSTTIRYGNYSAYPIQPPIQTTPSNLPSPGSVQGQYPFSYRN